MQPITRRSVLRSGVAGAAALSAAGLSPSVLRALAAPATPGKLTDIDHVVIFIQENRSFDHYFGSYPGVRGFSDPQAIPGVFEQVWTANTAVSPTGHVLPFHLNTSPTGGGECTPDPTHGWDPQHDSWDNGVMDRWGQAHSGDKDATFMGYYTRADLAYYYAIADAFTLCDAYHCSALASTSSNRLYSMTGMLDPEGLYGGPVKSTLSINPTGPPLKPGWKTYPEVLLDAGVTWKVYASPDANDQDNPLVNFQQYYPSQPGVDPVRAAQLAANGIGPTYAEFLADAAAGTLPQVSWVLASIVQSEHPAGAPQDGEVALQHVVDALTANPLTWPKTVLFYTYDENGGFFDHVAPPTPAPGTPGEHVVGETRPIGLGFRVPMLIVSPFSRGGFVARDVFDHTSTLRFLETWLTAKGVNNVTVPNLTDWRRTHVGDLTTALNFAGPDPSVPVLAPVPPAAATHPECATEEATMSPYAFPNGQSFPQQEPGTRPSPSGPVLQAQVPESPALALEVLAGAAVVAGAALMRRRLAADAQ